MLPDWREPAGAAGPQILGTELWNTETGLTAGPALRGAWYAGPSDTMFNQLRSPVLWLLIFAAGAQRYLVRGLTFGAVKE